MKARKMVSIVILILIVALIIIDLSAWRSTRTKAEPEPEQAIVSRDWDGDDSQLLEQLAMVKGGDTMTMAYNMMVTLNRVYSDDYPDTISGVIGQAGISLAGAGDPSTECEIALRMLMSGWDETGGDTEWK